MNYKEVNTKIHAALKESLKNKDEAIKSIVSILSARIAAANKDAQLKGKELSEEDLIKVFSSELKQAKETLEAAVNGNREMEIIKVEKQIAFIEIFLPKQMSEDEVKEFVMAKMAELNIINPTKKDFGLIMKNVSAALKGKADGKVVSQIVKTIVG